MLKKTLKAEYILVNKEPFINEALLLLKTILSNMKKFNNKNRSMLPKLEKV
jgi:hypothetical protein